MLEKTSPSCPDLATLAAMADGGLSRSERVRVLEHLDQCESCYEIVRETLHFLQDSRDAPVTPDRDAVTPQTRYGTGSKFAIVSGLIAAAVLLILIPSVFLRVSRVDWSSSNWWMDRFPSASGESVDRAEGVFSRVVAAVDIPKGVNPRFVVLDGPTDPIAFSVADGTVFLGRPSLDLFFGEGADPAGEARLAMVLGHELRHVVQGESLAAFAASQLLERGRPAAERALQQRFGDLREKELSADRWGLVYAAMAGFDPDSILGGEGTFFQRWVSQVTEEAAADGHPAVDQRASRLVEELKAVRRSIDYFQWGVRLYEVGRYRVSELFLQRFRDSFPSREVDNNLGLVHYQSALRSLARCDGRLVTRFDLPAVVDPETLASRKTLRGGSCYDREDFLGPIERAEESFLGASQKDSVYLPARLNLVSTYLIWGQYSSAADAAGEAFKIAPDDQRAAETMALADYAVANESGRSKEIEVNLERMRRLAQENPKSSSVAYNLASMLEEQHHGDEARVYWRRYLELEPAGVFSELVRVERLHLAAQTLRGESKTSPRPPLPLGEMSDSTLAAVKGWPFRTFDVGEYGAYRSQAGVSLLVEGSSILMEELAGQAPVSRDMIESRHGAPDRRFETTQGEIWLYDGFGFDVAEGQVVRTIFFPSRNQFSH